MAGGVKQFLDILKIFGSTPKSQMPRLLAKLGSVGQVLNRFLGTAQGRQGSRPRDAGRQPDFSFLTTPQAITSTSPDRPKPGLAGAIKMQRVASSNVHSIGYDQQTATLAVRYLAPKLSNTSGGFAGKAGKGRRQTARGKSGSTVTGKTNSPGPLYHYYDVPEGLWNRFQSAGSKGKWVWDNLRIRGTIAGHRYAYALIAGTVAGEGDRVTYIPRLATSSGFKARSRIQAGTKIGSILSTEKRKNMGARGVKLEDLNRGR
jgi:hypothetical protein